MTSPHSAVGSSTASATPAINAIVWIDSREARVFHFVSCASARSPFHPDLPAYRLHRKATPTRPVDEAFLRQLAEALADAGAILFVGLGSTKSEVAKYLHRFHQKTARRIVGFEDVDHPANGQIEIHARAYFNGDSSRAIAA